MNNLGVSLARRLIRRALPVAIRRRLGQRLSDWQTLRSPDRIYPRRVLLPQVARCGGTVLLVGCARYAARDPYFLQERGIHPVNDTARSLKRLRRIPWSVRASSTAAVRADVERSDQRCRQATRVDRRRSA